MEQTIIENYKWIDDAYEQFKKYNLSNGTMETIKEFLEAKKAYLLYSGVAEKSMMKHFFQQAHSELKCERSMHRISFVQLDELTELLKKGV